LFNFGQYFCAEVLFSFAASLTFRHASYAHDANA
jgi:hypothetical protein